MLSLKKLTLAIAAVLALFSSVSAFAFVGRPIPSSLVASKSTSNGLKLAKLSMAAKSETAEKTYWQGDWVCADCGYIYDADDCGGIPFEEQKKGWICPQCRGPRRRFAKMVGDKVGITQDGGDGPILLFSFLGFAGTIAFAVWFNGQ